MKRVIKEDVSDIIVEFKEEIDKLIIEFALWLNNPKNKKLKGSLRMKELLEIYKNKTHKL